MSANRIVASALTATIGASVGSASAAQLDYSLYAGMEHSDNIALSATNPISQNVLVPGVAFTFAQQGSTLQADVAGAFEYRDYLGNAYDSQPVVQLAGQLKWTVLPQRLDFTVQDFAAVQPLSPLASNSPDNQQQTNVLLLGPTLYFRLTPALQAQAELHYINSDASITKQFNSSRGEAALRVFEDLSPTDRLSANFESQHVNFYDASNAPNPDPNAALDGTLVDPNYNRNELFGRYVRQLAHFDFDIALGWSQIDFRGLPSTSSSLIRLNLAWRPTLRSTFTFAAARQYSDAAQDMMLQPGQILAGADPRAGNTPTNPDGINTGDSVIDPQVYLDRRLEATYAFSSERLTLSISPLFRKRSYLNDPFFNQTGRGGSGGINYRLTERMALAGFADVESLTYSSLNRRDRTSDYGLSLSQRLTPHWSWRVRLTHLQRDSTAPDQGYRDNEVYFGVVFNR
ncbi:surface lipoprotein assembly modifier [Rhodanobacter sp. BL-MT-08]